jgi:hypothetical protein
VKLPDLAETAESARAGIVVRTADVPITARTSPALRSRRQIRLRANVTVSVGKGDTVVRSGEVGISLQHISSDTQVKKRD